MSQAELIEYARQLATELQEDMTWQANAPGGYWKATHPTRVSTIIGRATAAREFFRRYAGPESTWTTQADAVWGSHGNNQSVESGAQALGPMLLAWASQVEAGMIDIAGGTAVAEIDVVNTDIMEQVRALLSDKQTHPAVPIVLAGAALEVALRALVEARQLPLSGKPSISSYAGALRTAELITKQDVKDIETCGGLRNSAAHGEFDDLSTERAGLMEQQVNLLLRRLNEIALQP